MDCGWKGPKSQSLFWTRKNIWTIKCLSKSPKTFCLSFHKFLHLGKRCPMTEWHQPRCILGSLHAANISWARPNNSAASAPGVNWSSASVPEPRCRSWFDPQKLPMSGGVAKGWRRAPAKRGSPAKPINSSGHQSPAAPAAAPRNAWNVSESSTKTGILELLPENLCAWYSNRF